MLGISVYLEGCRLGLLGSMLQGPQMLNYIRRGGGGGGGGGSMTTIPQAHNILNPLIIPDINSFLRTSLYSLLFIYIIIKQLVLFYF